MTEVALILIGILKKKLTADIPASLFLAKKRLRTKKELLFQEALTKNQWSFF
ncbi:hypothetical protein [Mucilaginibacter sp. PPCGB 2223]|uniref:hypothetical protein n=1 Tax=Mucilaginibacter sp. PPCGB 2223 TaxID=1886027 RepID=UPI00158652A8|nr:hypothetical protein [Mucilaginibacter sp. PPCGB 2223]